MASAAHKADMTPQEWEARQQLAACYRIFEHLGWSESIYNHISVAVPGEEGAFLINPFGLLYEEVTASNLVKIDVEGFELRAVRGMEQTLRRWGCPVIMEMDEHHLQRAHTSSAEVYAIMSSMGYAPFRIGTRRHGFRHMLELTPIAGPEGLADDRCHDVLWKRSGNE